MHCDEIGIDVYTYRDGTPYCVSWGQIRTVAKIEEFCLHLKEKRWATAAIIDEFRKMALAYLTLQEMHEEIDAAYVIVVGMRDRGKIEKADHERLQTALERIRAATLKALGDDEN